MTKRKAGESSSAPVTPMTTRASAARVSRSAKADLTPNPGAVGAKKSKSSASGVAGVSSSDNRPRLIPRPFVVIEHCVDDNVFKKKAKEVEKELKKANIGIGVLVNPENVEPRHGWFVIRLELSIKIQVVVSMFVSSPFGALRALDANTVVTDIAERVQSYRAEQYNH